MNFKREALVGAAWVASLLAIVALAWLAGYLYWQYCISRTIEEIHLGTGKGSGLWYRNAELYRIGSRGIPALLKELEAAVSSRDHPKALEFAHATTDAFNGAEGDSSELNTPNTYWPPNSAQTVADIDTLLKAYQRDWARGLYPPWWMWWSGRRDK